VSEIKGGKMKKKCDPIARTGSTAVFLESDRAVFRVFQTGHRFGLTS